MPLSAAGKLLAGVGIQAGTSLFGGLIGSSAASKAAQQQMQAAVNAQNFAKQQQVQALGTIGTNLQAQQGLLAPYQQAGAGALTSLSSLLGTPGQGLLTPWTGQFQAPTAEQAAATPGYQFQQQQAQKALQQSAAARGGLLTGGTAKALDQYTQGLASSNYQQTYNNAFQNYLQNYGQFQQNQANQYNRLMGVTGVGQWGAGAGVGALGAATGQSVGTLMDTSRQVGQDILGAGAAQASGTVGQANALMGALGGIGGATGNYALLSSLGGQGGGAGGGNISGGFMGASPNLGAYSQNPGWMGTSSSPALMPFNQSAYGPQF